MNDLYAQPITMFSASFGPPAPRCAPAVLPTVPTLQQIQQLEAVLRTMPQLGDETYHHFADGMYARELRIPKGAILTGKIHRQQHLNFLIKGEITVWTEQGMKRLKAPAIIVSEPGTKRCGYAHEDTIWVTVHASRETDLAELEAELIIPETPIIDHEEMPCLGPQ